MHSVFRQSAPASVGGPRIGKAGAAAAALLLSLVAAGSVAATPSLQTPTLPPGGIEATTGEFDLNVRAAPGMAQPIIGTLPPGAQVTVIGGPVLVDDWAWCEHQSSAGRGWSVCLGLEGAQYLAAGQPAPSVSAPAAGGAARPAGGPPPPPAMTPVRLPLPGAAASGGSRP